MGSSEFWCLVGIDSQCENRQHSAKEQQKQNKKRARRNIFTKPKTRDAEYVDIFIEALAYVSLSVEEVCALFHELYFYIFHFAAK